MKGTNSFTVRGADPVVSAKTAVHRFADRVAPRPAEGASFEQWLAYHEAMTPGGEFNELFAKLDAGIE